VLDVAGIQEFSPRVQTRFGDGFDHDDREHDLVRAAVLDDDAALAGRNLPTARRTSRYRFGRRGGAA
jgi:hypothetical protein